ncbi:hypothetical protein HHI36_012297 [Cryptolaemus montrouzieri]|uniref:Uncharacterized protein n=1 Tax=Cryptolaemus montrouzieri TaxID=559131 RepID=A0ABD2NDV0_9CUCU
MEILKEQIRDKENFIKRMQRSSQVFEEQVETTEKVYEQQIKDQEERIRCMKEKLDEANKEIYGLKDELEKSQLDKAELQQQLKEMDQIKRSMLISIEVLTEEIKTITSQFESPKERREMRSVLKYIKCVAQSKMISDMSIHNLAFKIITFCTIIENIIGFC